MLINRFMFYTNTKNMSKNKYSFNDQVCEACHGKKGKYAKCYSCNGAGEFESSHDHSHGCSVCGGWKNWLLREEPECKAAYGTGCGEIFVKCAYCDGKGVIPPNFILLQKIKKLEKTISWMENLTRKHEMEINKLKK